jgi:hypothetical protein
VFANLGQRFGFADRRRQGQRRIKQDISRNDRLHHRFERGLTDRGQHAGDFFGIRADMAFEESVVVLELAQRLASHGGSGAGVGPCMLHGAFRPTGLTADGRSWARGLRRSKAPLAPLSFCLRVLG